MTITTYFQLRSLLQAHAHLCSFLTAHWTFVSGYFIGEPNSRYGTVVTPVRLLLIAFGWILISIGISSKLVQVITCYGEKKKKGKQKKSALFLNLESRNILFKKINDFLA